MLRRLVQALSGGSNQISFDSFPAVEWHDCIASAEPAGRRSGATESGVLAVLQDCVRSVNGGELHALVTVYTAPDLFLTLSGHKSKGFAALHRDNGVESWWGECDRSPERVEALMRRFLADPTHLVDTGEWNDVND